MSRRKIATHERTKTNAFQSENCKLKEERRAESKTRHAQALLFKCINGKSGDEKFASSVRTQKTRKNTRVDRPLARGRSPPSLASGALIVLIMRARGRKRSRIKASTRRHQSRVCAQFVIESCAAFARKRGDDRQTRERRKLQTV